MRLRRKRDPLREGRTGPPQWAHRRRRAPAGVLLLAVAVWTSSGFRWGDGHSRSGLVAYAAALLRFPTAGYLIAIPLLLPCSTSLR